LYCGRQTTVQLEKIAVHTIGQLATLPCEYVTKKFGKNGHSLWVFANGLDDSRVAHMDFHAPAKSLGHGVTCVENIDNYEDANKVIVSLSQDIGYKLREMGLCALGVSLSVKDKNLITQSYQKRLQTPTQDELIISREAFSLLLENYKFREQIRALSVTAINLCDKDTPTQSILLHDYEADSKREKLNTALDEIKNTFGKGSIKPAVILNETKMPKDSHKEIVLPGMMHK
jgi:DNA polymerase-4